MRGWIDDTDEWVNALEDVRWDFDALTKGADYTKSLVEDPQWVASVFDSAIAEGLYG